MSRRNKTYHRTPIRKPISRFIFLLNLLLGGAKAYLLDLLLERGLTIVIDNPQAVEDIRNAYAHPNLVTFAMGDGLSTYDLYRAASADIARAGFRTANTSLENGYSALLMNGKLTAEHMVKTPAFQGLVESLPEEAEIRCDGDPRGIGIAVFGSLAGAANAGGHPVVIENVLTALKTTGIPIHVRRDFLGPKAFAKKALRGRKNFASGLLSAACDLTDAADPTNDHVSHFLHLHQLNPIVNGMAKYRRSLRIDFVAMNSMQMEELLGIPSQNWSGTGVCGNVHHRCVDSIPGLELETQIAPCQAKFYLDELKEAKDEIVNDPSLIDDLEFVDESVPQRRESIPELVSRAPRAVLNELVMSAAKPESEYRFRLIAHCANGPVLDLERLHLHFGVMPTELDKFQSRWKLCQSLLSKVKSDRDLFDTDCIKLKNRLTDATIDLRDIHQWIATPKLFQQMVLSIPGGKKRLKKRLATNLELVGQLANALAVRRAEYEAAQRAYDAVNHQCATHDSALSRVMDTLQQHRATGSSSGVEDYFAKKPIHDQFPKLQRLASRPREQQVYDLCAMASSISARGLAKTLGIESESLNDIADRIVQGPYSIIGPPHTVGQSRYDDYVIYAIPPMEPANEDELATLIRDRHQGCEVTFYDTFAAGAFVSRVRFQRFSTVKELFDGQTGADAAAAMQGPEAPLNSVDRFCGIEKFQAKIDGGRLVFPNDDHYPHGDGNGSVA